MKFTTSILSTKRKSCRIVIYIYFISGCVIVIANQEIFQAVGFFIVYNVNMLVLILFLSTNVRLFSQQRFREFRFAENEIFKSSLRISSLYYDIFTLFEVTMYIHVLLCKIGFSYYFTSINSKFCVSIAATILYCLVV